MEIPAKLALSPTTNNKSGSSAIEEEKMEAYHIDRFGNVDEIVRRSSEDPSPGRRKS